MEDVADVPRLVEKAVPSEDAGAPKGTKPVLEGLEAGGGRSLGTKRSSSAYALVISHSVMRQAPHNKIGKVVG